MVQGCTPLDPARAEALIASLRSEYPELVFWEIILELLTVLDGLTKRRHLDPRHAGAIRKALYEHRVFFSEVTSTDRTAHFCMLPDDRCALLDALSDATIDIRVA